MQISTDDMCRLAADFAEEYGTDALECARRAMIVFQAEGAHERAQFWFAVSVLVRDIAEFRLDPDAPQTIH